MYNVLTLNKIAACGTDLFDKDTYSFSSDKKNPEAILVRSADMHSFELNPELLAIARAGAGTNNIPIDKCSEAGIVVFNTPGANANAVKELVIAGLLLSSRKIPAALEWAKTLKGKGDEVPALVEKGKSDFGGPEILGKKLGIIGLGAIGALVANAAISLGMEVYGADPYLSLYSALHLSGKFNYVKSNSEIFEKCDYITLHAPSNKETKNMINEKSISSMKDGVRILNFARADLADDDAIIAALKSGKISAYVADFLTDKIIGVDGVIALPHLGASTPESEDNCAKMAVKQIANFLENGNLENSVNLPDVSMPKAGDFRICVIHKNATGIIAKLTRIVSEANLNIENTGSQSKGDYGYTILDAKGSPDGLKEKLAGVENVISVRII